VLSQHPRQGTVIGSKIHTAAQAGTAAQTGKFQHEGNGRGGQEVGVGVAVKIYGMGIDKIAVSRGVRSSHGSISFLNRVVLIVAQIHAKSKTFFREMSVGFPGIINCGFFNKFIRKLLTIS
jgi:hypothetical protein